ncbi:MAG: AbrB/MazE/SpoVT family DNA-binding domain-containing protein [Candidatus Acidiferrales bacterium]
MPALKGNRIRVGAKRQLTLPRRAAARLNLRAGDYVEVRVRDDRIELIPMAMIPRDQLWFWTPEWQAGEREADEDIKAGRVEAFDSAEELIRSLRRARKRAQKSRPSSTAT